VADIDIVCGRYGTCCGRWRLWPISFVADMVVADMVCGRYCCFPQVLGDVCNRLMANSSHGLYFHVVNSSQGQLVDRQWTWKHWKGSYTCGVVV